MTIKNKRKNLEKKKYGWRETFKMHISEDMFLWKKEWEERIWFGAGKRVEQGTQTISRLIQQLHDNNNNNRNIG